MERDDGADRKPVSGDAFARAGERLAGVRRPHVVLVDVDDVTAVSDEFGQHVAAAGATRASVGAAPFGPPPPDVDAMVTAADDAVYGQKRVGRGGVRVAPR